MSMMQWSGAWFFIAVAAGASAQSPEPPSPMAAPPNVVLIAVDGLRADHVGAMGYDKPTTPNLDAIAREGVLFDRCSAAAAWSLPAAASIALGIPPCAHGALADGDLISGGGLTLAQRLQSLGYVTSLFSSNPFISQATHMERGFVDTEVRPSLGERVFTRWQRRSTFEPFFMYVHEGRPQEPYVASEDSVALFGKVEPTDRRDIQQLMNAYRKLLRIDFDARKPLGTTNNMGQQRGMVVELDRRRKAFASLYDASIRDVDNTIGAIVEGLKSEGLWDRTLLIITGTVGMEMGEHGGWLTDHSLYNEIIHVPLVMRLPDGQHAGMRISQPVSHLDILPTILDRVGQVPSAEEKLPGASLLGLLRGESLPGPRLVSMRINERAYSRKFARHRGERNLAVMEGAWKGVWNVDTDTFELYDLSKDPKEESNVADQNQPLVTRMREAAKAQWANCPVEATASQPTKRKRQPNLAEMPEDVRKALQSLGYISETEAAAASQPVSRQKAGPLKLGGEKKKKKKNTP